MSTMHFSLFVGVISVIVFPVMATLIYADTETRSLRRTRLRVWQLTTLTCTAVLSVWIYLWVQPYGDNVFLAETPLWACAGYGIVHSIVLGECVRVLDRHQRAQEARLIKAALRP